MEAIKQDADPGTEDAVAVVRAFVGRRVLVIGDAVLDTYVEGTATRISREAPIPVVVKQHEERCAGGAANTAANLRALGSEVDFVAIVGADHAATALRAALRESGVSDHGLVEDPAITTPHKLRMLAGEQYVARIDEGSAHASSPATRHAMYELIEVLVPRCDLILIADYGAGTIDDALIEGLGRLSAGASRPLVIDARELRRWKDVPAKLVTPSVEEARALLGPSLPDGATPEEVAPRLRAEVAAEHIAMTMAGEGVLLAGRDGAITLLPTYPVARAGDIGAGDSFTAAMALALASGAGPSLAARIGIDAASIACTRRRTAVVPQRELLRRVSLHGRQGGEALSLAEIVARVEAERFAGKRIVFTNGVFDILHAGHVDVLRRARALGDVLVVGVNSDASVRRLKGPRRPINREDDRLALIAALEPVDHALVFDDDTPAALIRALRPDVHAKGGDYTAETLPEIDAVREVGAEFVALPLVEGRSTTGVIERIVAREETEHRTAPPSGADDRQADEGTIGTPDGRGHGN